MIPLRDINPTRSRPIVNYLLIFANTAVWLYQWRLGEISPELGKAFVQRWGLVPYYLTQDVHLSSLSTPLTSMFMHGGWLHLISNMWFLFIFGDNVEDVLGRVRYALFYIGSGLVAAVAQTLIDPSSHVPMVGASGAIAGVLGAYFRLFPHARVVTLIPLLFLFFVRELPAVFFIVVWFGLQLLSGIGSLGYVGQEGGVAFFAHIGGFVGGLWLVSVFGAQRHRTQGFRRAGGGYDHDDRRYGPPYRHFRD